MKMKTLVLTAVFGAGMLFQSCEKEENLNLQNNNKNYSSQGKKVNTNNKSAGSYEIITPANFEDYIAEVNQNLEQNPDLVDDFLLKHDNNTMDLQTLENLLDAFNITSNTYVSSLDAFNSSNGIYDQMNNHVPTLLGINCARLVQIRNALLSECDNYVWGLDELCSGAVMIAYWYHSDGC